MKPEAQRIAIARACGKVRSVPGDEDFLPRLMALPDYLNDLNAMHEAEEVLRGDGHWSEYGMWLLEVQEHPQPSLARGYDVWLGAHATAAQRAEAFLRVKGLWV